MTGAARVHPLPALCAALWIAAQIGYPLTEGAARDRLTVAVVLLSAATALTHAALTRGPLFAAGFVAAVSGPGLAAEVLGTATGYPFGCYAYAADRIGPALADVPLLIPLAWAGGLYPVWIVAGAVVGRGLPRIVATALGGVGWDLFLDPQMVADGQWTWCVTDAGLPGLDAIPVTNYLGWFAVGLLMATLLELLDRSTPSAADRTAGSAEPGDEPRVRSVTAAAGASSPIAASAEPGDDFADRPGPTGGSERTAALSGARERIADETGRPETTAGLTPGRERRTEATDTLERFADDNARSEATSDSAGRIEPSAEVTARPGAGFDAIGTSGGAGPWRATTAVPILVYLWTWLGSTLAHAVFLDLPASAVYGAFGMAVLGVPLLVGLGRQGRSAGSRAG